MNVEPVASGAVKVASPFSASFFKVTLILIVFLVAYGGVRAVATHDVSPLFDSFFRVVSSDTHLGLTVDEFYREYREPHSWSLYYFVSDQFYLWFWLVFLWNVILDLYFIFAVLYLLYLLFSSFNSSMVLRNWLLAVSVFLLLGFIVNVFYFYPLHVKGVSMPSDPGVIRSDLFNVSHPFSGLRKLFTLTLDFDLYGRVYKFIDSPIGGVISNIPNGTGVSS